MIWDRNPNRQDSDDAARAKQLEFISDKLTLLGLIAYKGYLDHGRGLVAVINADLLNKAEDTEVNIKMTYMSAQEVTVSLPCLDKEPKWLGDYNPGNSFIISFLYSDGAVSSYTMKNRHHTLKDIYERLKHDA